MLAEGTVEGDPLAVMGSWLYYTKKWWDILNTLVPGFGYFPKDKKSWIIAKPAKEKMS